MQGSLKQRYSKLEHEREAYLNRARACARFTIPSMYPPKGHDGTTPLDTPFQSLGARGVNNLASKLTLTMLPPNQPFFKLDLEESMRERLGARLGEVEKTLSRFERVIMRDIESSGARPAWYEAIKHKIVAGNVLTHEAPNGAVRVFPLTSYVVFRDPSGRPAQVILQEKVSPAMLDEETREAIRQSDEYQRTQTDGNEDLYRTVELYTGIEFDDDGASRVWQECVGVAVGKAGSYPKDLCPWIAHRLIVVDGEHYGRSYVEEYIGDILSLESLTQAMVKAAGVAAKVVFLANPNGQTEASDLEDADSGDVVSGAAEDITVLQVEKRGDFATVEQRIGRLTESLSYAFLLNSAVQRQAERVTAEEIRYLAQELNTQLGGLYPSMTQTIQLPMVRLRMHALTKSGKLPVLDPKFIRPTITTGVDAIGRGNDFDRLRSLLAFLAETLGPDQALRLIQPNELAARAAAALGVEEDGLIKSAEQLAAEAQQAQQAAMMQQALAPTINAVGKMATAPPPTQQETAPQ